MKKLLLICSAIACVISSCKKDLTGTPAKETGADAASSELIYWDDLPDEYKNAVRVSPETVISERSGGEVLPNDPYKQDQVFNPFNLTSENFSLTIPPYNIRKIAIGKGKNGVVSHISIWYSTRPEYGILYVVSSGGSTNTPMVTYTAADGEYIQRFSGRSSNGVLKDLTISTNKGSVSTGSGSTGTYFSFSVTLGSFIGKFSGNAGTVVSQLKATAYFLPWQKVSASNARDIAMDTTGTVYVTDAGGALYQMSNTITSWSPVPGAPSGITKVAAFGGWHLCVITNNGKIYNCDKSTGVWSERQSISNPKDLVINGLGQIFVATSTGIYYNNNTPGTDSWIRFTSGNYKSVACDRLSNIRAIDNNGNIFSFGIYGEQMPGSNGRDIHTAFTAQIWLVNTSGKISFINYPNITTWKEIGSFDAVRIAAVPGKVMMVNSAGEVYKLKY